MAAAAPLPGRAAEHRRTPVFNLAVCVWNFGVCPREDHPSNVLLAALIAPAGAPAGLLLRLGQLGIDAHARYACDGRGSRSHFVIIGICKVLQGKRGLKCGNDCCCCPLKGLLAFWPSGCRGTSLLKITPQVTAADQSQRLLC